MKNWKFDNIPEESHFFWGGNPMPYLNFLSILSFRKLNPDWKINLYTSPNRESTRPPWQTGEQSIEYTGRDYFSDAAEIADQVYEFDFPRELNHDVHKADFMRIYLMNSFGGLWSDFDVLYVQSIDTLAPNSESVELVLPYTTHLSIGVILAKPDLKFFRSALSSIEKGFDKNQYQSLGINLLHQKFGLLKNIKHYNPPMVYFYPYYYTELHKLYEEEHPLPEDTIAVHWYGGNELSMKYRNIIDENYAKQSPSTMSAAINKVLEL